MRGLAAVCFLTGLMLGGARADDKQDACSRNAATLAEAIECVERARQPSAAAPRTDCNPGSVRFVPALDGRLVLRFGERTQYGTTSKGLVVESAPTAMVRAPADGVIVFAGAYRSYGNIVVLAAGCDLQITLGGVDSMAVARGQSVTAGQALGTMTPGPLPPVLYIEMRNAGRTIDPGPAISGQ